MATQQIDKIAYYRRTDKSLAIYKNIQNSHKCLLNSLDEKQLHTFYSVYCIYDVNRQSDEYKEFNLRKLLPEEMSALIESMVSYGYLEQLYMNDIIMKKIYTMQSFVDGNY